MKRFKIDQCSNGWIVLSSTMQSNGNETAATRWVFSSAEQMLKWLEEKLPVEGE